MTKDQLREVASRLLAVALEYRTAANEAGLSGAVIWLQASDGGLVIVTRGEYRDTLMENIDKIGKPMMFGTSDP